MANKTVRITILENKKFGDVWVSSDTDLSVQNNDKENLLENLCDSYDLTNIMKQKNVLHECRGLQY